MRLKVKKVDRLEFCSSLKIDLLCPEFHLSDYLATPSYDFATLYEAPNATCAVLPSHFLIKKPIYLFLIYSTLYMFIKRQKDTVSVKDKTEEVCLCAKDIIIIL